MRLLVAGNKERGGLCLRALVQKGHEIVSVIAHSGSSDSSPFAAEAILHSVPVVRSENINSEEFLESLRELNVDLVVLAGFGPIVGKDFIDLAPLGCINLHGGKLPEVRGSSPMNWALIHGHKEFGISIIRVDKGVDTGDVLGEKIFKVSKSDQVSDLQNKANQHFPEMLVNVVEQLEKGTLEEKKQNDADGAYYPLRFPDDGFILWDQMDAEDVLNMVRGLSSPFPGAFTYYKKEKITIWEACPTKIAFHGVPGRIYRIEKNSILVCAKDRAVWLTNACDSKGINFYDVAERYQSLATVRETCLDHYRQ